MAYRKSTSEGTALKKKLFLHRLGDIEPSELWENDIVVCGENLSNGCGAVVAKYPFRVGRLVCPKCDEDLGEISTKPERQWHNTDSFYQ